MGKMVCPKCKRILSTSSCPVHKNVKLLENWKGRIIIIEPEQSDLAKRINKSESGEYALK